MKGFDPNALFAQAKKMKDDMAKVQGDLRQRMVEGKSGGGAVAVVMNGQQEIQSVRIKKDVIDPSDPALLEDLVLLAVREALEQSKKMSEETMKRVTGGLNIPGLF
jgi:DNA-binding YbaB/EbfC family protein